MIPGCSTCGQAVEVLRSCYESRWHLFKDDPARTTPGRYYFVPPGTPVYEGWHNLGSRTWWDANYETIAPFGEDAHSPHKWFPGTLPAQLPRVDTIIGNASCLQDGDLVADGIAAGDSIVGFPPACFIPSGLDPVFIEWSDIWRCKTQLFYALLIEMLYNNNIGAAIAACRERFGPDPVITWHAGGTFFPGVLTIITPDYTIVAGHGTTEFQQIALYSFYGIAPPNNFGIYSTNNAFYLASTYLHNVLMGDGSDITKPIFMAGHSYGGAMCLLLAARYRYGSPGREIRFITYGAPKSGDVRLKNFLANCQGVAIENDQDFVPLLPPDLSSLAPIIAFLGMPGLTVWVPWERCPTTLLQFADGTTAINLPGTLNSATLLAMVQRVLAHLTLFGFPAHPIGEYIKRIALRCQPGPIPAAGSRGLGVLRAEAVLTLASLPESVGRLGLSGGVIAATRVLGGIPLGADLVRGGVALAGNELALGDIPLAGGSMVHGAIAVGEGAVVLGNVTIPFGDLVRNAGP